MFQIFKEHKGFGKQIFLLAKNELIKTYKGAVIGPFWAVIKPAFTLFVYWFAFQIGDGKCVFLTQSNGKIECNKSIPWDERCFLNKTTSLCDSQAIDGFRFCYQGDGNFPMAVFLGSDGLDDTYGDEEGLYNFYIELYKLSFVLNI